MTRILFVTAFLLGASAVVWMGAGFVGTDALALTVTVVIGLAYTIGFIELVQFRQATGTLSSSLATLSQAESTNLDEWLNKLHPSLHNSVRLRIEGERVGLPAPVMTPYLVGLLVMLGLLGTFVGMVDTLKGAVIALEGTTELQAVRAGLAAPIKGLGLAFGTSVAGVAASAMLGLLSTLSRRERMVSTRKLDSTIATVFRCFSLTHNRQETYKALQVQSTALPDVAEKLQLMASQMERMGETLSDTLVANQEKFHESVTSVYSDLASSVDKSLRESLSESGRLAGESIKPIVQEAMVGIKAEAKSTHQQLTSTVQTQLETLTDRFGDTSDQVTQAWKDGLSAHEQSNEALIAGMSESHAAFSGKFEGSALSMLSSLDKTTAAWVERQDESDKQRLDLWTGAFKQAQENALAQLTDSSNIYTNELKQITDTQQRSFASVTQKFESMSATLTQQWQEAGEQSLNQQHAISESLESTARSMTEDAKSTSTTMLVEMTNLLKSSEALIQTRIDTEQAWLGEHSGRMTDLTSMLKEELQTLRADEERRGQAAVDQLSTLEETVTSHLGTLGRALEEPMTRLIETASETPRAAAEVISHLRREISNNIERDNGLLEERQRMMEELNTLIGSLEQSSTGQREAVEMLVDSSSNMLKNVGSQFTDHVGSEVTKLSGIAESLAGSATEIADNFAGSAVEMSSLGEAFGFAVQLFNESNSTLIENLTRIESSLENSNSRSDEQLGYYVAQARDIIDHSLMAQKEIFEELRQLSEENKGKTGQAISNKTKANESTPNEAKSESTDVVEKDEMESKEASIVPESDVVKTDSAEEVS